MARPNKVKAYDGPYAVITRKADGAITAASVVTSGTNEIDVAEAVAGDNPTGVAEGATVGDSDDLEDGDEVNVIASGIVRVEANASISEGTRVKADAGGTVQPIAGDGTDTNQFLGRALESGSDGDVIEVALE